MVIRKYSVGYPDNEQQKVQFVKLLGSTYMYIYIHIPHKNIIFWCGRSNFIHNIHACSQEALLARDYLRYEERVMQFAFFTHLFLRPLYLHSQHFSWRPEKRGEATIHSRHSAVLFNAHISVQL